MTMTDDDQRGDEAHTPQAVIGSAMDVLREMFDASSVQAAARDAMRSVSALNAAQVARLEGLRLPAPHFERLPCSTSSLAIP